MSYFGCHLSNSKGNLAMVNTARAIGANTFAFFTRNPRGSKAKPEDAVDAATDNILRIIDELKKAIEEAKKQNVVTVPGTCEHHGPFCNIKIHKLWPILFFISLFVNIVLVVVIIVKKKKKDEE